MFLKINFKLFLAILFVFMVFFMFAFLFCFILFVCSGQPLSKANPKKLLGFVDELDVHLPRMTVKETFEFAKESTSNNDHGLFVLVVFFCRFSVCMLFVCVLFAWLFVCYRMFVCVCVCVFLEIKMVHEFNNAKVKLLTQALGLDRAEVTNNQTNRQEQIKINQHKRNKMRSGERSINRPTNELNSKAAQSNQSTNPFIKHTFTKSRTKQTKTKIEHSNW
jgi:hypothetical protein